MPSFLRILALALLFPTLGHAALTISPAQPLADPAERTGSYRPQQDASVAWNGERGLVAWRGRVGQRDVLLVNHVDSTGKPLEPAPVFVAEGQLSSPRVAALGERFLVIWNYYENTTNATRAALIAADGTIQLLGRIGPDPFSAVDLASNGTTAIVAGSTGTPDYLSAIVWIDEQGNAFSSKTFGSALMLSTRVTTDGTSFFVVTHHLQCGVYTCDHTFYLVRARADGTSDEPRVIRAVGQSQSFHYVVTGIAASHDRLFVTFQEPLRLAATILDHEGNTVSGPFEIEDSGAAGSPVAVASDGSSFVVAYPHARPFGNGAPSDYTTRLRRVGTSGASEPSTVANHPSITALAWTGSGYLLARAAEFPGVSVTRLPPSGVPIAGAPEHIVSHAPNQQETPDAVWENGQLFTAWEEFFPVERVWKVKYGRNDANGNPLDGRGRLVATSAASQRNPRVVFDGSGYLIVWTETAQRATTIHARRVDRNGLPVGNAFFVAPTFCSSDFDATRLGTRILVVHQSEGCDAVNFPRSVVVSAIEVNDMVTSTVVAQDVTYSTPSIESAGASALVVWAESIVRAPGDPCPYPGEYCPPKQLLRGAILGDGATKRVNIADDDRMMNREAQLAWNGRNYLVAWVGGRDVNSLQALYTRAFTVDGTPMTSAQSIGSNVSFNYGPDRRGSIIATASGFLVAWQPTFDPSIDLWRVTASGQPMDTRPIETLATDLRVPHLVQGPGLTSFLVYSLGGPKSIYLGHNRIVFRTISETRRVSAVRH